ncbi:hypothetical protein ACFL21_01530 [Patescibacteria group bacterium]
MVYSLDKLRSDAKQVDQQTAGPNDPTVALNLDDFDDQVPANTVGPMTRAIRHSLVEKAFEAPQNPSLIPGVSRDSAEEQMDAAMDGIGVYTAEMAREDEQLRMDGLKVEGDRTSALDYSNCGQRKLTPQELEIQRVRENSPQQPQMVTTPVNRLTAYQRTKMAAAKRAETQTNGELPSVRKDGLIKRVLRRIFG